LGSVSADSGWHWAACGKHPVARDFFTLGKDHPLFRALSECLDKGYRHFLSSGWEQETGSCSWRFWIRGSRKHALAFGVVKDSCDLLGRPYPLLIMGMGTVHGWEENCDLVPLALENSWSRMEYLAAKKHRDIEQLRQELKCSMPPRSGWEELRPPKEDRDLERSTEEIDGEDFRKGEFLVTLQGEKFDEKVTAANLWHHTLKRRFRDVPTAVFIGGNLEQMFLFGLTRPLGSSDFVTLWSLCHGGH
jgi:type VI secretion system ImpM family protein